MSAMQYLVLTRTKNRLKSFLKNPVSIVLILLMLAAIYFLGNMGTEMPSMGYLPMSQFYILPFLAFCLYASFAAYQGLGKGASLFTMTDVQMLFPSPIKPLRILIYGVFRSLLFSLLTCLYILFQTQWMKRLYNIPFTTNLALMLLCGVCLLVGQLVAINLYAWLGGRPDRKRWVSGAFFGVIGAYAVYGLYKAVSSGIPGFGAVSVLSGDFILDTFPIGGWVGAIFRNLYENNWLQALLWMIPLVALMGWLIYRLSKVGDGFYEDVLESTARTHQAVLAQKEGRMAEVLPENVKVGRQGIGRGKGAGVIFAKHLLEDRRGRKFLMNTRSVIFVLTSLVSCFFLRELGLIPMMAMALYMAMISLVFTGRWVRELALPWVYRIPAPSWKVFGATIAQTLVQYLVESVIIGVGVGIMAKAPWEMVALAIFARFITCVVLLCVTTALDLVLSGIRVKAVVMIFYYLFYFGIIGGSAFLAFKMVSWGMTLGASWEIAALIWYCAPMVVLLPVLYYLASYSVRQAELNN